MITIYIKEKIVVKILIIYAHPNRNSFCGSILKEVQKNLATRHSIKLIDLYADDFDPRLTFNENNRRRDLAKEPETQTYRDLISWADHLIFIFPIWWGGMPGILKGFIDRVFVSGFAFHYEGLFPIGHLKGRTAWVITTHDTPSFALPFLPDYGKTLKKFILRNCGIKVVKSTAVAHLRGTTLKKRQKALKNIASNTRKI